MGEKLITSAYGPTVEQGVVRRPNVEKEFELLKDIGPFLIAEDNAPDPALFTAVHFGHRNVLVEPRLFTLGGLYNAANLPANDEAGRLHLIRLPDDGSEIQPVIDAIITAGDTSPAPVGSVTHNLLFQYVNDPQFIVYLEANLKVYGTFIMGPRDILVVEVDKLPDNVFIGSDDIYATLNFTGVEI